MFSYGCAAFPRAVGFHLRQGYGATGKQAYKKKPQHFG
jgi:hypothetical protein